MSPCASLAAAAAAPAATGRRLRTISGINCSRSRSSLVVRASWGAPVDFTPAKIVRNSTVAEKLHSVVVDVGDLASGYTKAGQFMQMKVAL